MGRPYIPISSLPTTNTIPRIEVKPFGNWSKTISTINGLGRNIKQCSIKAQIKVCMEIQKRIKAHLRNQDLGWKRLNKKYLQAKSESGLDSRTLMAWHTYYNNIKVWKKPFGNLVMVGVPKGIYTKNVQGRRSRLDVASIAVIHEFASGRKFPRRQLWNPTIQEIGGIGGIKKIYINSLYYWLRVKGVPVTKISRYI